MTPHLCNIFRLDFQTPRERGGRMWRSGCFIMRYSQRAIPLIPNQTNLTLFPPVSPHLSTFLSQNPRFSSQESSNSNPQTTHFDENSNFFTQDPDPFTSIILEEPEPHLANFDENPSFISEASENPSDGSANFTSIEGIEENVAGDEHVNNVAEVDDVQVESVLSILQSMVDGSVEDSLDKMGLALNEEFMLRVIKSPGVSGDRLIRFFTWAWMKSEFSVSRLLYSLAGLGKREEYVVWDLIRENGEKEKGVLNTDILNELISQCPDYKKVGSIISCFCKGNMAEKAHLVYLMAKEKNKCASQSCVTFLISSLCKEDHTVKLAMDLLHDLTGDARKDAIKPFADVVHGLCRIKETEEAKKLFFKMMEDGPQPRKAEFDFVIDELLESGDTDEARKLVDVMESRGLRTCVYRYSDLMSGYVKGGQMDDALEIFSIAKKKYPKLCKPIFHTMTLVYCKLEEFDKAVELLNEMNAVKRSCWLKNADEYHKIIQSLSRKALDWETAEKLLKKARQNWW